MSGIGSLADKLSKVSSVYEGTLRGTASELEAKIREGFARGLDFYSRKQYKSSAIETMKRSLVVKINGNTVEISVNSPILYKEFSLPQEWREAINYAVMEASRCLGS